MASEIFSITMAAGASSRMPAEMRPKACCKVGLISIIENALRTYEHAGIRKHVIVVGAGADRVMAEVSARRKNILFAFQPEPKGTGDAVRCALELLDGLADPPEHVLISAGDKLIAPHIIRELVETYTQTNASLALVTGQSKDHVGSAKVLARNDAPVAIIELPDIRVKELATHLRSLSVAERPRKISELDSFCSGRIGSREKLAKYVPALEAYLNSDPSGEVDWARVLSALSSIQDSFDLPGGQLSSGEIAELPECNLSIYLGLQRLIRSAIAQLRSDNIQGEWYFTDIVRMFAEENRRMVLCRTHDDKEVMSFNTLQELEGIRRVYAARSAAEARYPMAEQWTSFLRKHEKNEVLLNAVDSLARKIGGERQCIIVRSPGRINLMGRHIDHQGGTCNLLAIDREIVIAASPREDDRVNLWNALGAEYPNRTFTFSELTADIVWEDWLRTLGTQFVQRTVSKTAGDWSNYVKGAALRLQHRFKDRRLRGMDAFVTGSIPPGAGLSSSSALLVAAAEALTELNALNVGVQEFVDLCGEGEWFVGTRGGSADHAAIKYSQANSVVKVSFFPFRVLSLHPFPEDCRLLVCYSGTPAKKTESARARFNARVACYHMAREVIKQQFPQFAPLIEHLRDVNQSRLKISLPALYTLLRQIPNKVERSVIEELAAKHPTVAKCVGGLHLAEHDFPLRDVALYGLAEFERAARASEILDTGNAVVLGKMMALSHDGDRVTRIAGDKQEPFQYNATDELLDRLVRDSASLRALDETQSELWQQPGAYACSTADIDCIVDMALKCPGVLGAQLAGAGLGGCAMVLIRQEMAEQIQSELRKRFYEPRNIEPVMFVCQPSRGSQVMTAVEG